MKKLSSKEIAALWGDEHTGNTTVIQQRVLRIYEEGVRQGSAQASDRLKLIEQLSNDHVAITLAADFLENRYEQ